jgi:peroxiredoxin
MISTGTQAPDFELSGIHEDGRDQYRLSDFTDEGTVLIAFYPCDFSPMCTRELCAIQDIEWFSFDESVQAFGVSQDSLYAHREFVDQHDITFPLLSDTDGNVTESYDVRYDSWEGQAGIGKRALFVVDDTRTVRYAWSDDDAYQDPNLQSVLDAVLKLHESAST